MDIIKKEFNLCSIEKCFNQAIGNKPVNMKSSSVSEFDSQISRNSQCNILSSTSKLIFVENKQEVDVEIPPRDKTKNNHRARSMQFTANN